MVCLEAVQVIVSFVGGHFARTAVVKPKSAWRWFFAICSICIIYVVDVPRNTWTRHGVSWCCSRSCYFSAQPHLHGDVHIVHVFGVEAGVGKLCVGRLFPMGRVLI